MIMELDDMKQSWKRTDLKTNKNTDIMELVQHKTYGPVAALKREFRKQILLMALMPFLLITTNLDEPGRIFSSIIFWSYVLLCIGMVIFGYMNYRVAARMENRDTDLRSNLEQQVNILETRLKWKLIALRIVLAFFILLLETVPYIQHYRMLDKWHALPVLMRVGIYAGFLILQYFLSRRVNERKFGSHLSYLKELVREISA